MLACIWSLLTVLSVLLWLNTKIPQSKPIAAAATEVEIQVIGIIFFFFSENNGVLSTTSSLSISAIFADKRAFYHGGIHADRIFA